MPPKKVTKKVSPAAGLIAPTGAGGRGRREHRQESLMSSTEFDTTRTPRAGFAPRTSATRIWAALLALAAIGAAVVVCLSQARTPHTTAVVLVDSSGPDTTTTTTSTGTGSTGSTQTSQATPVYEGPPTQTWTRGVTDTTVQRAPQTIEVSVTPRPAPCPTKLRICEPVHF
jgi:hypothetical protein